MGKILVIAEKPDAARAIAAALCGKTFSGMGPHRGKSADGDDITVISARGHLYELAAPEVYDAKYGAWNPHDLPIVPTEKWKFIQMARKSSEDYIRLIGQEVPSHAGAEIVNACDAGREGELIFRKVVRAAKPVRGTTFTRLWAQTMTDDGLREAFKSRQPLASRNGLAMAGQSRDEADWLVGMNMTVLATKTLPRGKGEWKVWSVGRVQTPTLALVEARDALIENFIPQPFWEVFARFGVFEAKADLDRYAESPDRPKFLGSPQVNTERDKKAFWSRDKAEAFKTAAHAAPTYAVADKLATRTEKPPLPFDLQEMQKLMSKKFGLSGTDSLGILQTLYEAKLISYPRTDSRYLPEDMKEKLYGSLRSVLRHLSQSRPELHMSQQPLMDRDVALAARAFDSKKVSDHYGLVPTGEIHGVDQLKGHSLFAYLSIVQQSLMALDTPAKFKVITRRWTQEGGTSDYSPIVFRAEHKEIVELGFARWQKRDAPKKSELGNAAAKTQAIDSAEIKESKTNPPDHYTDATLLDAMKYAGENIQDDASPERQEELLELMKDRGIGTPATRSAMIDKLVQRAFLERRKSSLVITPNGRMLIRELREQAPSFLSAKLTAEWEMKLKEMEQASTTAPTREQFLDALLAEVVKMKDAFISGSKRAGVNEPRIPITEGTPIDSCICPKSKKPLLDRGPFYEAPGYPKLRLYKKAFGREFTPEEYLRLLQAHLEQKPYQAENLVTSTGRTYNAELVVDKEEARINFFQPEATKVKGAKCPKSKKAILDHGKYFEAPGWEGVRLYKEAFGRTFTAEEWVAILEGWVSGTHVVIDKMVSKKGTRFSAMIVLDAENRRVRLEFPPR